MKRFLLMVLAAVVLFIGVSAAQEWQVFVGGASGPQPRASDPEQDRQLEQAVREYVALVRHFYQSGGDPRFAERLPASERVTSELLADIEYLKRNGRVQVMRLMKLDVLAVERISEQRAMVRTTEYWVIESRLAAEPNQADPVRSQKVHVEYWLDREGIRWNVGAWDFIDEPPPKQDGQDTEGDG